MRPNSNEQAIGTTVEAHGDQSTGPKHNETAEGTAAEAHELFTDEELVEVFRVLFQLGQHGHFSIFVNVRQAQSNNSNASLHLRLYLPFSHGLHQHTHGKDTRPLRDRIVP
ncbi:hypothetical protein PGT21_000318 [Puccinia graminis f. sp. tritici]|uniref:Uncharacterized protein n=1 Tax=Puccinia graminis f. sp. tritici TaxID=56615 RepID=A0A5B0LT50_PUCGR|nr:hypothetical protein PGT21_000318 [Puccinia graminis f. sp. tritici]